MRCEGIDALTGKAVELQIEQGHITGIKPIETSDPRPYLAAGFFDIQVNGYRGHSAAEAALIGKAIEAGARDHALGKRQSQPAAAGQELYLGAVGGRPVGGQYHM